MCIFGQEDGWFIVICVREGYLHLCMRLCVCEEVRRGYQVFCSITLCLVPLRQSVSLNLELGRGAACIASPPIPAGVTATAFQMGSGIRTQVLKYSGPVILIKPKSNLGRNGLSYSL